MGLISLAQTASEPIFFLPEYWCCWVQFAQMFVKQLLLVEAVVFILRSTFHARSSCVAHLSGYAITWWRLEKVKWKMG